MRIDREKLNDVARELSDGEKSRMKERKKLRHLNAASSAIALKIKRQLKILELSQLQLAEMLGVTPANITRYLSGKTNFELKTLVEIERALGIKIIDRTVIPAEEIKPLVVNVNYSFDLQTLKATDKISAMEANSAYAINIDSRIPKNKEIFVYG